MDLCRKSVVSFNRAGFTNYMPTPAKTIGVNARLIVHAGTTAFAVVR